MSYFSTGFCLLPIAYCLTCCLLPYFSIALLPVAPWLMAYGQWPNGNQQQLKWQSRSYIADGYNNLFDMTHT